MQCAGLKRSSTPNSAEHIIQLAVYKEQPVLPRFVKRSSVHFAAEHNFSCCFAKSWVGVTRSAWIDGKYHNHVSGHSSKPSRWLIMMTRKYFAKKQCLGYMYIILTWSSRVRQRIFTSVTGNVLCPSFSTLIKARSRGILGYSTGEAIFIRWLFCE